MESLLYFVQETTLREAYNYNSLHRLRMIYPVLRKTIHIKITIISWHLSKKREVSVSTRRKLQPQFQTALYPHIYMTLIAGWIKTWEFSLTLTSTCRTDRRLQPLCITYILQSRLESESETITSSFVNYQLIYCGGHREKEIDGESEREKETE